MRIRTQPASSPVNQLGTEVERLFDAIWNHSVRPQPSFAPRLGPTTIPAINVWEDDERVLVEAEVPGLTMENLDLLIHGDELTIRGQRKPAENQGATFLRQERWMGQFERTLRLPAPVDQDAAEASLHHGVLTITLPKAASARPRKIEIRALPKSQ